MGLMGLLSWPSVSKQGRGRGRGGLSSFVEARKPKWAACGWCSIAGEAESESFASLAKEDTSPALGSVEGRVSGCLGLKLRSLRELDERLRGEGGRSSTEISNTRLFALFCLQVSARCPR